MPSVSRRRPAAAPKVAAFIALMRNNNGDPHIRAICSNRDEALWRLRDDFLKWRSIRSLGLAGACRDPSAPTLEEMDRLTGGATIIEVRLDEPLYVQLEEGWDFSPNDEDGPDEDD